MKAFEDLGGREFVKEVAREGPKGKRKVMEVMAKMLPKEMELSGKGGAPIGIVVLPEVKKPKEKK